MAQADVARFLPRIEPQHGYTLARVVGALEARIIAVVGSDDEMIVGPDQ